MDRCSSCGAPIEWGVTAKPRRIPLDPEGALTDKPMNLRVVGRFTNGTVAVEHVSGTAFEATRISHFATCPDAEKHRKRR